jgi:hypothetical protein
VATSSSPVSRFVDYLSSRQNVAGVVGGLVGAGIGVTGVGGAFWPLFVVALYGAGALAMPPRKVTLVIESASTQASELRKQLSATVQRVDQHGSRMPPPAIDSVHRIGEMLGSILTRPDLLTVAPEELYTAGRIVQTDLPTSLETYLNLPWWYAAGKRMSSQPNASEQLVQQLALIEKGVTRLADQVYGVEGQRMSAHTEYLKEISGDNELESGI